MFLLADSLMLSPGTLAVSHLVLMGLAGLATFVLQRLLTRAAAAPPGGTPAAGHALEALLSAHKDELGFLTDLFRAIASNDSAALTKEIEILGRLLRDRGSFANMLEDFVAKQLQRMLGNPQDRSELLATISRSVGHDVEGLIEQANAAPPASAVKPAAVALLLALALGLGCASPAPAQGPQKFEPTPRQAVIDAPTFLKGSEASPQSLPRSRWAPRRRWFGCW